MVKAKRADINGAVSPYWLRHAHGSHAIERGASLPDVQATLGHTTSPRHQDTSTHDPTAPPAFLDAGVFRRANTGLEIGKRSGHVAAEFAHPLWQLTHCSARFVHAEQLVLRRAREIYAQGHA